MKKNEIGLNAGKIWQLIDKQGELTLEEMKKKLEFNDFDCALSLGWLARENKIYFTQYEDTIFVGVTERLFKFFP